MLSGRLIAIVSSCRGLDRWVYFGDLNVRKKIGLWREVMSHYWWTVLLVALLVVIIVVAV